MNRKQQKHDLLVSFYSNLKPRKKNRKHTPNPIRQMMNTVTSLYTF